MKEQSRQAYPLPAAAPPRRFARSRPLKPATTLLLLAALCLPCPAAHAQTKPNIAGDVEGGSKTTTKRPSETKPAPRRKRPPAPRPEPTPEPTPAPPLDVIFYTGLAEADVYLNQGTASMQKLGRSDADGRLVARLPRGLHTVTASRPGSRVERRQIEVRPGSTTFFINLSDPDAAGAAGSNVAAPVTASEVFRRYLDPKQTDGVTIAEWQLALVETAAAYAANPLDPQIEAQALFARGQVALLRRDFTHAIIDFNNAALKLPSSALAFYGLGNAYLGLNRLNEAARAYQQATQINSQFAMAFKGWGDVLARQDKNRDALRYYERARVLGYTSSDTRQVAARILLKERRWPEALREMLEVSKTTPTAEVFLGIGDAYVGLNQPLNAAPAYRRAIELDPKSALAHYKFGELAYAQRDYAAAAESLERALALDPAGALIDRGRARDLASKAANRARGAH